MSNETSLWYDVSWTSAREIKETLAGGADPNEPLDDGNTPLILLVGEGEDRPAVVQLLLEAGGDVNGPGEDGFTPLLFAAQRGLTRVTKALLEAGAAVDLAAEDGRTPLMAGAGNGHRAVVAALLMAGADVNAASGGGWTALMVSARQGHRAIVRLLLDRGAKVNVRDADSWTALMSASLAGDRPSVKALLHAGAEVDPCNAVGQSALSFAMAEDHPSIVKLLRAKGASWSPAEALGWAVRQDDLKATRAALGEDVVPDNGILRAAILSAGLPVLDALLAAGAVVNGVTEEDEGSMFFEGGDTPLMLAARLGRLDMLNRLLEAGADVAAESASGDTALTSGASANHREVIDRLLEAGADLNQGAQFHALYYGAEAGEAELVAYLLDRGAAIDQPIWTGTTALLAAAQSGDLETVTLLLGRGADPNAADRHGTTALMVAAEERAADMVGALLAQKADPSPVNDEGRSALMNAAHRGCIECVRALLDAQISGSTKPTLDVRDAEGGTALHHASSMNEPEIVTLLLDAGASLEVRDGEGFTPLMRATENGYTDLMLLLLERRADRDVSTPDGQDLNALAFANGRDQAIRVLDGKTVSMTRIPDEVQTLAEEAEQHYAEEEYDEALALYQRIPEAIRNRIFAVLSNMGYCRQQLGDQDEALDLFEAALELEPDRHHLLKALCYTYYEEKRWADMQRCARKAVELDPEDSYSWQQVGIACTELGDPQGAIDANRHAVELEPSNGYAQFNLAWELYKAGKSAYLDGFRRAFSLAPELVDYSRKEKDLAKLRKEPGFAKLLGRK